LAGILSGYKKVDQYKIIKYICEIKHFPYDTAMVHYKNFYNTNPSPKKKKKQESTLKTLEIILKAK